MSAPTPLHFYNADFCPFAQRTWIALLEKESDPHHPKLFHTTFVNFFNKELPETKSWMAATGVSTVPSGTHNGLQLSESLLFNEYVNDLFPHNPLLPESAADKFRARILIEKHGSKLATALYKFLKEPDQSQWASLSSELLTVLKDISADLSRSSGPFFFGSHFTLTDIAFFPFIERASVLLSHYRAFSIPSSSEYSALNQWFSACLQRESVKISTAERVEASLKVLPFEAKGRKEFLVEVYEGYAANAPNEWKKQLATAPAGKKTFNLEVALKEKNETSGKL